MSTNKNGFTKMHKTVLRKIREYVLGTRISDTAETVITVLATTLRESEFSDETRIEISKEILEIRDELDDSPCNAYLRKHLKRTSERILEKTPVDRPVTRVVNKSMAEVE